MAKFELKFIDNVEDSEYIRVEKYNNEHSEVISIFGHSNQSEFCIWLDKSTAIKFAKTLRTEINKIKDEDNG